MNESRIVYREESYRIIGACFEVYNEKGNGYLESVYQECLGKELGYQGIPFEAKRRLNLHYKGRTARTILRAGFLLR